MSFDEIRDRLQETYKSRKCDWCHKPCRDCDPKCQCLYCKFPDSYDSLDGSYQQIKNWIMQNLKFYEKLYKKGLASQNLLMKKMDKRQLFTIEKTGTRAIDWTPDYEIIGVPKIHHDPPEGYDMITPYHDYRKPKDLRINYCQICGTNIEYNYYIKHEENKQCIRIGHECAEAFCLSDLIVHNLKAHMREIIKEEFKRLKPHLIKSIKEKIKRNSKNKPKLERALERITQHFENSQYKIPPEGIAKLLLELKKYGIDIVHARKSPKKEISITTEKSILSETNPEKTSTTTNSDDLQKTKEIGKKLDETIHILILDKMKKLSGVFDDAINDDKLIQEMENHGLSRDEIVTALNGMVQRKEIYKFLPHYYKILKK